MSYAELLLGCGKRRSKLFPSQGHEDWQNLVTLDFVRDHRPDITWDLNVMPWHPLENNSFDEVHCYEVIEHLGQQGDFKSFLRFFEEVWRILKPDGLFCATVPRWDSEWAWGDPGHTRVVTKGTLAFLSQAEYQKHVGNGPMSDYREWYDADFDPVKVQTTGDTFGFALRAVKPSRKSV